MLVLNPEWITKGVYRIINWVQNQRPNAEAHLNDFKQIFQGEQAYPEEKHLFLFKLIQEYELAYAAPRTRRIVVPQCLSQDQPAASLLPEFPPENSLSAVIQASSGEGTDGDRLAFPPDVMPRFIVRRSEELSKNKKLIWRFGTILELAGGTIALVQQDDYAIKLSVKGPDKSSYFAELRDELKDLLSGYQGLQRYQPGFSYYVLSRDGNRYTMLPNDEAYNLLRNIPPQQQDDYHDPKTNLRLNLRQMAQDYRVCVNIGSISFNHYEYNSDDHSTHITYNFHQCNLALQSSLRELANELQCGKAAKELRGAADLLEQTETCQSPGEVKKRGILPKLQRCMEALNDESSTLRKAVSGVANGVALVGKILSTWNQMAQWGGWPAIPGA